jgi:CRP-like cAMP-binding protein
MFKEAFHKGEIILAEGTRGDRTYRILSGEVVICKESKRRKKIPIAILGPGEVFGEMYLLDKTGYRSATAIAVSNVVVEVISEYEMRESLKALPPHLSTMLSTVSQRLRKTSQHYALQVATKRPKGQPKLDPNHGQALE